MNDNAQLNEVIFEALLKTALIEFSYHELESYPTDEELEKMENSLIHLKMRRYIRFLEGQFLVKKLCFAGLRGAMAFLIVTGITFCGLLGADEVRASCLDFIKTIHERYIQYDINHNGEEKQFEYEISYLPEGYFLVNEIISKSNTQLICSNGKSEQIIINISHSKKMQIHIDNENCMVNDFMIGEWECQSFIYSNYKTNKLAMHSNNINIIIEGNLPEIELIKTAKNFE